MTNNLFRSALEKKETNDFFRGKNGYFVAGSDYEGHVHGALMSGHARSYAEENVENARQFDNSFVSFIQSLKVNREELSHLLANVSSYFANKSRKGFSGSCLFQSKEDAGYQELYSYLEKVINSNLYADTKEQIERHSKFVEKKGSNILSNICSEIKSN